MSLEPGAQQAGYIISLFSQVTNQGTRVKSIVEGHKRQKEANEAWAAGSVPQLYRLFQDFPLT